MERFRSLDRMKNQIILFGACSEFYLSVQNNPVIYVRNGNNLIINDISRKTATNPEQKRHENGTFQLNMRHEDGCTVNHKMLDLMHIRQSATDSEHFAQGGWNVSGHWIV